MLELPARWIAQGIHPLPAEPLAAGLLRPAGARQDVRAAHRRSGRPRRPEAAYQALLVHPLGPKADKVQAVLEDLLETNRPYLPQFFK